MKISWDGYSHRQAVPQGLILKLRDLTCSCTLKSIQWILATCLWRKWNRFIKLNRICQECIAHNELVLTLEQYTFELWRSDHAWFVCLFFPIANTIVLQYLTLIESMDRELQRWGTGNTEGWLYIIHRFCTSWRVNAPNPLLCSRVNCVVLWTMCLKAFLAVNSLMTLNPVFFSLYGKESWENV